MIRFRFVVALASLLAAVTLGACSHAQPPAAAPRASAPAALQFVCVGVMTVEASTVVCRCPDKLPTDVIDAAKASGIERLPPAGSGIVLRDGRVLCALWEPGEKPYRESEWHSNPMTPIQATPTAPLPAPPLPAAEPAPLATHPPEKTEKTEKKP